MGAETQTQGLRTADAVYRAHMRAIYGFIYTKVGNRESAEDLTSEVFLKAVSHLDPSRDERSIVAWLYRVATNKVNDYWRARQGPQVIELDEARISRGISAPSDNARREATAQRATALLQKLPVNYREVLSHRLLEGMSVAETARQMGTSEANVKVLQHRALKYAATIREGGDSRE